jgi:hypothetical protein
MFAVVVAVAVHGNLVPTAVTVQSPTPAPPDAVQSPPNDALVISKFCADETFAVNDDRVQLEVRPPTAVVLVNARFGESSVCSEPTTPQLAAEAIDGITNAHNAITPAKSNTPFLDNFFITNNSL